MIARRHRILQSLALFGLFSILPMFLQAELTVGMEGAIEISCEHELLEAKAVDHRADVIIRIANIEERKGRFVYDLRYIVNRPGSYDLRDFLVRSDGAPLQGLQPIPVSVSGLLPAESKGDLEETFLPPLPRLGGYRLAFSLGLVLWLVPIVFIAVRSLREKKTQEEVADVPPPTLADQLRPLVEAALHGELSTEDRGRLELLLVTHWRRELALEERTPTEVFKRMREHSVARQLLEQLELWLHRQGAADDESLAEVLEPYRKQEAIELAAGAMP